MRHPQALQDRTPGEGPRSPAPHSHTHPAARHPHDKPAGEVARTARPIFLDNHSTTPMDPRACAAMDAWLHGLCGNPSSPHVEGESAKAAMESARAHVAELVGASPEEVSFTPGATAANNVAIWGLLWQNRPKGARKRRVVVSAIEHKSVSEPARAAAESLGYEFAVASVDHHGRVRMDELPALLKNAELLSVQLANNEIGAVQDIRAIAALAQSLGVRVHVDATQGIGKVPFDMRGSMVDLVSLASHKLHGPKGVGAIVVREGLTLRPLLQGGTQEHGLWPGTQNVPAIVGFGEACKILIAEGADEAARVAGLRATLAELLAAEITDMGIVGPFDPAAPSTGRWPYRLPGNLSIHIPGISGRDLVERLKGTVCLSTGAACNCPKVQSDVLRRIGLSDAQASGVVRMGLGRFSSRDDIVRAAPIIGAAVRELRSARTSV